jgi:ornithine cyclodeaminase/alanine dehydrogenase
MSADDFLILSDAAMADLGVGPVEIADAIESALRAESTGGVWTAPKAALLPGDGRYVMATLSASDAPPFSVVKTVMVSPRNPDRGRPAIDGTILLHDSETGALAAVLQAGWVTAVRTAGLSVVAARRLADPGSRKVAFVGCGVQARSHLEAFAAAFPLSEIACYGRGQANIDRLCAMAEGMGLAAAAHDDPQAALRDADLVVTSVTLSFDMEPFLDARWLKPGAFAAVTDAGGPWSAEGNPAFGAVIVDDLAQEAASARAMIDPALLRGDLKGLIADAAAIPRDPDRPNAFFFRGLAIGDFAVAALAVERARALERGRIAAWDG